jgi:hypothetical protein
MERDRQHGADLVACPDDLGHHARGRQRDAPPRQRQPFAVGDDLHRRLDVVEIVERLAHAHEHHVGDVAPADGRSRSGGERLGPLAQPVAGDEHLAHDLARRQVAHQLLGAGMAEAAGERAADLAGDAQGAAVLLGDIDRLDLMPAAVRVRRKPEQPLAGAVRRHLLDGHLRPGEGELPVEAGRARPWRYRS